MPLKKSDWVRGTGDESYAEYMLRARRRFEQGQVATVRQVRQIYRRAAEAVRQDIAQVTPGTLRHGHLKALAKALETRARELTDQLLAATRAGIQLATRDAVSGPEELVVRLVEGAFDRAEVRRLFAAVNERALMAFLARTGPDGLKLSDRVWRTGERWRNAIIRVLEDGIARGEDARKLALEVQRYLQPGVWTAHKLETRRRLGVSADVSYEAMRLVRTEMNNAFHEATIMANRAAPSYLGVHWRLSGEHPFPDVCDDYARHNGDGFWPRGQEPVKPHPQCMCVVVPRHERPEEFSERLRQWLRDPQSQPGIEDWYNRTARQFLKRPPGAVGEPQVQAVNMVLAGRPRRVVVAKVGAGTNMIIPLDLDRQEQQMDLMAIRRVFQQLPEQLRNAVKAIHVLDVRNPDDPYWERVYGIPGFRSYGSGGHGSIQLWANGNIPPEGLPWLAYRSLVHEAAHNLDAALGSTVNASWYSVGQEWEQARFQDAVSSGKLWVSAYAEQSRAPWEDFADSVILYLIDPSTFWRVFPRRAEVLRGLIGE